MSPKFLHVFWLAVVLAGCATSHPVNRYKNLASSSELVPNEGDKSGHIPFTYSTPGADWSAFTQVVLEPVGIYEGADHQLGDTSAADRSALAAYIQSQFSEALKAHYTLVSVPSPATLRIRVTLTGIQTSTPVISTLWKVAPAGLVVNSVQSARGKQAAFTGSVSYAVEIYDCVSNKLLRAYVTKQYPFAENVAASVGTLDASKAGVRNGAQALLAQLH